MVDPDGVALAAIQGLCQIVQEKDREDLRSEALRGVRILCALSNVERRAAVPTSSQSAIYARFALWEAIDE